MTQSSRPQADHINNFPLPSDPGPYSADQWSTYMGVTYTSDNQATQGPLVTYLNELEPTNNGTTQALVDTGAGYVNGHFLISDEQETFVIPAGPAGGRTDRVVMVENNSNVEITQTVAGRPLLFPNDLSEYTATPGIPAYSARLAIVRGNDAGALPGIDQTTALYMVELGRYDINAVPTISSDEDRREYVATPMAGLHKLRETVVTGGPLASITLDNIPQNFRHLILRASLKASSGGFSAVVHVTFNSATLVAATASYHWAYRQYDTFGGVVVTSSGLGANVLQLGETAGNSAAVDADGFGTFEMIIHDYASAHVKDILSRSSFVLNTPHIYGAWGFGGWDYKLAGGAPPNEGITLITFAPSGGGWTDDSIFTLYGTS